MLTKTSIFQKPIIVSKGYIMAERVKRFRLGICIPQENPIALLKAIDCLVKGGDLNGNPLNPDFEGYCNAHSIKQLSEAWEQILNNF